MEEPLHHIRWTGPAYTICRDHRFDDGLWDEIDILDRDYVNQTATAICDGKPKTLDRNTLLQLLTSVYNGIHYISFSNFSYN